MSRPVRVPGKRVCGVAGALTLAALLAMIAALGGAMWAVGEAAPILERIGPLTRILLPTTAALTILASTLTVGGAVLAGWVFPAEGAMWTARARSRTMLIVAGSAAAWTILAAAQLVLSYALAAGQPLFAERFGSDIGVYMTSELGAWMMWAAILAAVATVPAFAGSSQASARWTAALGILAIGAKGMTGHAAGTADHETATSAMFFHLLAVALWVGPLVLLVVAPRAAGEAQSGSSTAQTRQPRERHDIEAMHSTVRRFSALALMAWVLLSVSGALSLLGRVSDAHQFLTDPYGQLVSAKIALLLVLGGCGFMQRQALAKAIAAGEAGDRPFVRLALTEIVLMGVAVGLGSAMSSSPPPGESPLPPDTPAGILTGAALPPPVGTGAALGQWQADVFACTIAALVVLWRAAHRDQRGTGALTVAAIACAVVASSPLAVYARVLASAHVLTSLALMVGVGVPLGVGLHRIFSLREGGERTRTRVGRASRVMVAARWCAAAAPAVFLLTVYASPPVLDAVVRTHPAHLAWMVGAGVAGALWVLSVGVTEHQSGGEGRRAFVAPAVGVVLAGGVLVWIATTYRALAPSWFGAMGRTWRADTLMDQHAGALAALAVWALAAVAVLVAAMRRP